MKLTYTTPDDGEKDGFHSIEVEEDGDTKSIQHFHESEVPSFDSPGDLIQLGEALQHAGHALNNAQAETGGGGL